MGIFDFYFRFKLSKENGLEALWRREYGYFVLGIGIPLWLMLSVSIVAFIIMII